MIDPSLNASVLGSSTDILNFWYSSNGFNNLYAQSFNTASDSTIKENIETLSPGALHKVMSLRPVSFNYKNEINSKLKIGLIAQEVEAIIPEAVSFNELGSIKMIDYDMLIPLLIEAIQEQQSTIESLQVEINKSKSETVNLKSASISEDVENDEMPELLLLEQNAPNPFSQNTVINYYLPIASKKATLLVYNMNGLQIKSIQITQMGKGNITISGSELSPGIYLYTLIADGRTTDTKRMILTE